MVMIRLLCNRKKCSIFNTSSHHLIENQLKLMNPFSILLSGPDALDGVLSENGKQVRANRGGRELSD
jgi:hypothetical protein